jgi:hypothetical protein
MSKTNTSGWVNVTENHPAWKWNGYPCVIMQKMPCTESVANTWFGSPLGGTWLHVSIKDASHLYWLHESELTFNCNS